jgi:hypothetical protein
VVEYAYNVEAICIIYECICGEVLIMFHGK